MVPLEYQIDNEHCPHTILNRYPLLQKISLVYKKRFYCKCFLQLHLPKAKKLRTNRIIFSLRGDCTWTLPALRWKIESRVNYRI